MREVLLSPLIAISARSFNPVPPCKYNDVVLKRLVDDDYAPFSCNFVLCSLQGMHSKALLSTRNKGCRHTSGRWARPIKQKQKNDRIQLRGVTRPISKKPTRVKHRAGSPTVHGIHRGQMIENQFAFTKVLAWLLLPSASDDNVMVISKKLPPPL